jgi:hypothetical protein
VAVVVVDERARMGGEQMKINKFIKNSDYKIN